MSVEHEELPRCDNLDGSSLRIVRSYTEAGYFCEANCITVTDGKRTAIYVPLRAYSQRVGDRVKCNYPGSWIDGKEATVVALDVVGSDGISGHLLQFDSGQSVVPPHELELLSTDYAEIA